MVASNWKWWQRPPAFGLRARFDQSSRGLFVEDDEPRIGVITDELHRPIRFEAIGLSHHDLYRLGQTSVVDTVFSNVFVVFASSSAATTTLVPGSYAIQGSRLIFVPLQPLLHDVTYRAVLYLRDHENGGTHSPSDINIHHEFEVPRKY